MLTCRSYSISSFFLSLARVEKGNIIQHNNLSLHKRIYSTHEALNRNIFTYVDLYNIHNINIVAIVKQKQQLAIRVKQPGLHFAPDTRKKQQAAWLDLVLSPSNKVTVLTSNIQKASFFLLQLLSSLYNMIFWNWIKEREESVLASWPGLTVSLSLCLCLLFALFSLCV